MLSKAKLSNCRLELYHLPAFKQRNVDGDHGNRAKAEKANWGIIKDTHESLSNLKQHCVTFHPLNKNKIEAFILSPVIYIVEKYLNKDQHFIL